MKIIFVDKATNEQIIIYHNPTEIIIKPRAEIVKVVHGADIIEYKYHFHQIKLHQDFELDTIEYIITIVVDREPLSKEGFKSCN